MLWGLWGPSSEHGALWGVPFCGRWARRGRGWGGLANSTQGLPILLLGSSPPHASWRRPPRAGGSPLLRVASRDWAVYAGQTGGQSGEWTGTTSLPLFATIHRLAAHRVGVGSLGVIWRLAGNAESQPPPQAYWCRSITRASPQVLCTRQAPTSAGAFQLLGLRSSDRRAVASPLSAVVSTAPCQGQSFRSPILVLVMTMTASGGSHPIPGRQVGKGAPREVKDGPLRPGLIAGLPGSLMGSEDPALPDGDPLCLESRCTCRNQAAGWEAQEAGQRGRRVLAL